MVSSSLTGATSGRGSPWIAWWSMPTDGTGWSSIIKRPRGSWVGISIRGGCGRVFIAMR